MAIAFDQQLGSNVTIASGTTQTLSTGNTVASGGTIFLLVGGMGNAASSVSGGSLTWVIDKAGVNGNLNVALVRASAPAGIASGTTITVTYAGATTSRAVSGFSFTGVDTSSPVDGTPASQTGTTVAWTSGAVTTANATDVVIGLNMLDDFDDTTSTPTAGWTEVPATAGDFNTVTNGDSFTAVYQIVASTGTYTPGGTWAIGGTATVGVAVAYKAGAGVTTIVSPLQLIGPSYAAQRAASY